MWSDEERRSVWHRLVESSKQRFALVRRWLIWRKLNFRIARANRQAFVLWHGPGRHATSAHLRPGKTDRSKERYYLFPDRLRGCFWVGGVFSFIILFFNAFDREPTCQSAVPIASLVLASLSLIFCVYLAPFFIYVLGRSSVLDDFAIQLPEKFKSWMRVGINTEGRWTRPAAPDGASSSAHPIVMVLRWMTPLLAGRGRMPVAYDGLDSRQGRLTRIAMAEFFNSRHTSSKTYAIYNWILYGLAPLWVFLILMILVIAAAAFSEGDLIQKEDLLLFDLAWILLAATFFIIEMPRMPNDLMVKADDLASLPSQITRPRTGLVMVITNASFRLMLNAAVTVIAVVYATLAALV